MFRALSFVAVLAPAHGFVTPGAVRTVGAAECQVSLGSCFWDRVVLVRCQEADSILLLELQQYVVVQECPLATAAWTEVATFRCLSQT